MSRKVAWEHFQFCNGFRKWNLFFFLYIFWSLFTLLLFSRVVLVFRRLFLLKLLLSHQLWLAERVREVLWGHRLDDDARVGHLDGHILIVGLMQTVKVGGRERELQALWHHIIFGTYFSIINMLLIFWFSFYFHFNFSFNNILKFKT